MSELATPVSPIELPKPTLLDQADIDTLTKLGLPLTTQEQVDAVKADLAALPQVQADLAAKQVELDAANDALTTLGSLPAPEVMALAVQKRANDIHAEYNRLERFDDFRKAKINAAMVVAKAGDVPVLPTLSEDAVAFMDGGG